MAVQEHNDLDFSPFFAAYNVSPFVMPVCSEHYSVQTWALLLESSTNEQRLIVWPRIKADLKSSILAQMHTSSRVELINVLTDKNLEFALNTATGAEAIEIINSLPEKKASSVIRKLSSAIVQSVTISQSYATDQIGRYANPDVYTIKLDDDMQAIISDITASGLPQYTDSLIVIDEKGFYQGLVEINTILTATTNDSIKSLIVNELAIQGTTSLLEASTTIKTSKRSMLPIITDNNLLLGRISISDALNIFQSHFEAQIAHLGKVNDEDLFAPTIISAKRRATWLGINLITAFMASIIIGVFDKVVSEVVALAILMPIVASMGGIIRNKELRVSVINGVLWAIVVAIITGYWFNDAWLSAILAMALVVNMFVAALFGLIIPMTLNRLKIDPALAGSVILTTVTDVVGFFVFLGAASIVFLN